MPRASSMRWICSFWLVCPYQDAQPTGLVLLSESAQFTYIHNSLRARLISAPQYAAVAHAPGWRKPHPGVCWVLDHRVRHLFVAASETVRILDARGWPIPCFCYEVNWTERTISKGFPLRVSRGSPNNWATANLALPRRGRGTALGRLQTCARNCAPNPLKCRRRARMRALLGR